MALSRQYVNSVDVCRSKHRYGSASLAERVAAAASKRAGIKIGAYKCGACPWWHLTSRPTR